MTIENGMFWNSSWNPIHVKGGGWHCTKISPGCLHCWSESMNIRYGNKRPFKDYIYHKDTKSISKESFEFVLDQRILEQPLHWKKCRIIAVQWLGDIFHEQIPNEFIYQILNEIGLSGHTYLILTKRPKRMKEIFDDREMITPNLWTGLSICTQQEADEKMPVLLQTPAAHRFVNFEPLLEDVGNIEHYFFSSNERYEDINGQRRHVWDKSIDWVLLGAESGPGRRPMRLEWARNISEQCKDAGIPLWIKQLDVDGKVEKDMNEFPEDLRIREFPW